MVRWVRFWDVPLYRRLETMAVFIYAMVLPVCLIMAFNLLVIPLFWGLAVPYLIWIFYIDTKQEKGGRRLDWVRNSILWRYFRDYFPISLVVSSKYDPKKNYIFAYHPHGIISIGAFCNFATNANHIDQKFPGLKIHLLTLESNFKIPFLREVLMSFGMSSVAKKSCENILNSGPGSSICLVVGGAEESLDARPGLNELTLKKRKGFVKLALVNGASLVPVYSFGENDIYDQVPNPRGSLIRKVQTKIKNLTGIAPPLIMGRGIFNYDFGFLPVRHKITTVVGEAIDIPKVTNPTNEVIDHYHEVYVEALQKLFDKYKDKIDKETGDLKIH
ncbi:monoacylglycerol O-acyltransferase [Dictyostelium purpureum]|uniref:Acyltransferase n=1 Tax=Dictyostelium purpureum TaxID=5786 RepID=F1A1E3_DICPU|nr:monoacylglycerol O-acyltransferase [Dictyostelium purpureum]EGC29984.1 monoacylglycerol O-acyltransferase [Dictyostelium purpureum]|eukprot:XP_003293487.1 monoacylglycerol O-acyltransferase [Dictyostelium purpureum]